MGIIGDILDFKFSVTEVDLFKKNVQIVGGSLILQSLTFATVNHNRPFRPNCSYTIIFIFGMILLHKYCSKQNGKLSQISKIIV